MAPAARVARAETRRSPRLSRERIVDAAFSMIEREGLERFSMRGLGLVLGVEAMALYYYFRSKAALLDAVCDRLFAQLGLATDLKGDWSERLRRGFTSFYDRLRGHPNLIPLVTSRPMLTPAALRATEVQYSALRAAGLGPKAVIDAHRTLGSYVFGYLLIESQFTRSGLQEGEFNPDVSRLSPDELPATFELMPFQAASGWAEQFQLGLDLILAGIMASAKKR